MSTYCDLFGRGVQQSNHWWSARSSTSISSPFGSTSSMTEEHEPRDQHVFDPPRKTSALRLGPKPYSKVKDSPWIMRVYEAADKEIKYAMSSLLCSVHGYTFLIK